MKPAPDSPRGARATWLAAILGITMGVANATGCSEPDAAQHATGVGGSGTGSGGSGAVGLGGFSGAPPRDSLGGPNCPELSCLPCAEGASCAESGPYIDGTCCSVGDALVHRGQGAGEEVVDVEYDGEFAYLCGGFGVRINRVSDPHAPVLTDSAASRCQRIALGQVDSDGSRTFYLSHHGDSWVPEAFLGTYRLDVVGHATELALLQEPGVLYEGMTWRDGHLYSVAHEGGLRVYATDAAGIPALAATLGGLGNAWKLDLQGDFAYVASAGGLAVVDVSVPSAPSLVQSIATTGSARDVDADGDRVFVALGGAGVDVFDSTAPKALTHIGTIDTEGSAQAVSASGDVLAVAAWNHVAVYDRDSLVLLATERTRANFEQDLGVSMHGVDVAVGEWTGLHMLTYRPGFVAPDVSISEELVTLPADVPSAHALVLRNRGQVPLSVASISTSDGALTTDVASLEIATENADFVELHAASPGAGLQALLTMQTNDPDPFQSFLQIPIQVGATFGVGVGDPLTNAFGFLDPNGAGQLAGLQGRVILLAYFALF